MIKSSTRFQYAATLLGALAIAALAPTATAFATNDNDTAGPGGCHYTDADGFDIPIHNGEGVLVDGKTVTCKDGAITVSKAVKPGGVLQQQTGGVLAPVNETPKKPPVVRNVPVQTAQR
ncbi:MAG: hypothetical protein QOD39_280 [Mycobacterium sp.]|jgi:hypothetical protein|nr:hypothetical protein [Mycobacterium sp.]